MFDGLKQVFTQPFIRSMALLMVLGDCIGTVGYVLMTDYSHATFVGDAIARTRFAARVDAVTNITQIVVQLTITRWLLVRWGAAAPIGAWALASVAVLLSTALSPTPFVPVLWVFPWAVLALIVTRSLSYGMVGPARESLYTRVPRELRYQGKNAVDTAVWRAGDVVVASSMNGLRALGMGVPGFALLAGLAAAVSGWIGWRLARRTERG